MSLEPDPNLPPVLELRSLKPYHRREVMNLWERLVGVGIENTLEMVFDDEVSGGVNIFVDGVVDSIPPRSREC